MTPDLESPDPREAEDTDRIIERMRGMMASQYGDAGRALMRRDVHQKAHGLMRAEFTVEDHLPEALRVGLFARPGTYPAWVRLSNAANGLTPDARPDVRGMAIKVMGVPGRKVLDSDPDAPTHDFIVISTPRFPVSNVRQFYGLAGAVIGGLLHKLVYFLTHPRTLWGLIVTFSTCSNPLQIRYYSATPYLFGRRVVKYGVTPRFMQPAPKPADAGPDFLRQAAREQLAQGPAWFDFGVQFRRDDWSIEDGRCTWPESKSPFQKVASLRILGEDFDTPERQALGEQLSFTPWHCLPEHRPLGNLNRARRRVYETLHAYRYKTNGVSRREPDGWECP